MLLRGGGVIRGFNWPFSDKFRSHISNVNIYEKQDGIFKCARVVSFNLQWSRKLDLQRPGRIA